MAGVLNLGERSSSSFSSPCECSAFDSSVGAPPSSENIAQSPKRLHGPGHRHEVRGSSWLPAQAAGVVRDTACWSLLANQSASVIAGLASLRRGMFLPAAAASRISDSSWRSSSNCCASSRSFLRSSVMVTSPW